MKLGKFLLLIFLILAGVNSANFILAANTGGIVINEVAWMGTVASYNDEWIELRNNTGQEINLDGWVLKAADGIPEIKLTGNVPVNGFYLLERTDDNTVLGITADQIYTGALGNNGENLELYDNLVNLVDSVNADGGWPAGDNTTKQTLERTSSYWQTSQNSGGTPKAENSKLTETSSPQSSPQEPTTETITTTSPAVTEENTRVEPVQIPIEIIYPSGVVISEILSSPTGPDEEEEWIEIFNQNNFGVDLSGWQITDIVGKTEVYIFPNETAIGPGGFLVLPRPTTKITLNNQGDGLKLIQPDGNVTDEINYQNAPRGESYGLFESGWAWTPVPTPGNANISSMQTLKPEEENLAENGSPQDSRALAAVAEQTPYKFSVFLFLAAVFTSFLSGVIILVLRKKLHVRS